MGLQPDNSIKALYIARGDMLELVVVDEGLDPAALDEPGAYTVNGEPVAAVARFSFCNGYTDACLASEYPRYGDGLAEHHVFVTMQGPVASGASYRLESPAGAATLDYDDLETLNLHIKVNQVGYALAGRKRHAFYGLWAGSGGAQELGMHKEFQLRRAADGQMLFRSPIRRRRADPAETGEHLCLLDFSRFREPGEYYVAIPGAGRSVAFEIGRSGPLRTFKTLMRGILHQRCGCEIPEGMSRWPRGECAHCRVRICDAPHDTFDDHEAMRFIRELAEAGRLEELPVRKIIGGYHDAGDWDRRIPHFEVCADLMNLYEMKPAAFAELSLGLPEAGNGIPDLLNEACWSVLGWANFQEPDGAVRPGAETGSYPRLTRDERPEDPVRMDYVSYCKSPHASLAAAAVFAQFARLISEYDEARAGEFLGRAHQAYAWAVKRSGTYERALLWAAAELFKTTGEPVYNETVKNLYAHTELAQPFRKGKGASFPNGRYPAWSYASCGWPTTDAAVRKECAQFLIDQADNTRANAEGRVYASFRHPDRRPGYGSESLASRYAQPFVYAFLLTRDRKYLDAISLAADYQLGANSLGRCMITGLGTVSADWICHRESSYWKAHKGRDYPPVPGVPVFGITDYTKYEHEQRAQQCIKHFFPPHNELPLLQSYCQYAWMAPSAEFTINGMSQCALVYGFLACVAEPLSRPRPGSGSRPGAQRTSRTPPRRRSRPARA